MPAVRPSAYTTQPLHIVPDSNHNHSCGVHVGGTREGRGHGGGGSSGCGRGVHRGPQIKWPRCFHGARLLTLFPSSPSETSATVTPDLSLSLRWICSTGRATGSRAGIPSSHTGTLWCLCSLSTLHAASRLHNMAWGCCRCGCRQLCEQEDHDPDLCGGSGAPSQTNPCASVLAQPASYSPTAVRAYRQGMGSYMTLAWWLGAHWICALPLHDTALVHLNKAYYGMSCGSPDTDPACAAYTGHSAG